MSRVLFNMLLEKPPAGVFSIPSWVRSCSYEGVHETGVEVVNGACL